ncbi:acyl-CoA dehydrogenase, partial [Candidatus Woesearchaeota archaeon]|nr:acyl-CoA dehydrogenase [Candidatus Woesearchaeota archaeon]
MDLGYKGFSQEDDLFREGVKDFVNKEQLLQEAIESDQQEEDLGNKVIQAAKDTGYFGVLIPEEYDGVGGNYTHYAILAEEVSRACFALSNIIAVHSGLCTSPIIRFGSEEQKQRYLPRAASGDIVGAIAMTEPNAGSNIAATETIAREQGDHYVLNGTKRFITNAVNADIFFTIAYTGDRREGPHGNMSAFVVERDWDGVSIGKDTGKKMGLNAVPNSDVIFEDVKVPKENILGEQGQGYEIQHVSMEYGRIFLAACALGMATEVFERSLAYSQERVFPTTPKPLPLHKLQTIQRRIAEMASSVNAMSGMVYSAT